MKRKKVTGSQPIAFPVFIFLYLLLNLFFLDSFPFVHSDEAWLASLTRAMAEEKSLVATEDFFRATERNPHALKSFYHILQLPFVLADFSVVSVRLLSLFASAFALFFLYRYFRTLMPGIYAPLCAVFLVAVNIQFLYAARFARQEMLLLLSAVSQLYTVKKFLVEKKTRYLAASSAVSGISIFIHPNAFIIFSGIFFYFTSSIIFQSEKNSKDPKQEAQGKIKEFYPLIFFSAVTAGFYLSAAFISIMMDRNFLGNYLEFGRLHGTAESFFLKILSFPRFIYKIANRIEGTYYLPDVRFQFYLFIVSLLFLAVLAFLSRKALRETLPEFFFIAGAAAGIILIGKYSPPSAVFILFPMSVLYSTVFFRFSIQVFSDRKIQIAVFLILFLIASALNLVITSSEVRRWKDYSFSSFGELLKKNIPAEGNVLAGTYAAFFLEHGKLCSYHDFFPVAGGKISFSDYIEKNKIKTIVWSEELEIIATERPQWNGMYGNIYLFYNEAKKYLAENCEQYASVVTKPYAVRLAGRMLDKEHHLVFYRVLD